MYNIKLIMTVIIEWGSCSTENETKKKLIVYVWQCNAGNTLYTTQQHQLYNNNNNIIIPFGHYMSTYKKKKLTLN